jgi:CheY-like chemotaxis protein
LTNAVPVIAVSANAMKGDEARGLEAGFAAYFTKPLVIPVFLAALDRAIERANPDRENQA